MADIQSNINVNIDTSNALASIKALQSQISAFHTSMARGGAQATSSLGQQQQKLLDGINATGKFSAQIQNIKTTTESFTTALEKNKLSLGQYFKYSVASTKSFGKAFTTEMNVVEKVARERVKSLQTQYINLGRDANGALKAISIRPLLLDLDNMQTKTAIAAQKQQILNQLLSQGSTNLLNFGKNTQWAGRQLMVGFTIPLSMAGTAAAKAYMDIEKAAIKIKRVYGDLNTSAKETNQAVDAIKNLASEYTKYGIAVADTMEMAASAAAMGKTGADLLSQVNEATRLATLGGVSQSQALETTISLTSAFGYSTDQLAGKIDYLNAVENQTVTSIEDLTTAIPKAGPVVKQLGGNIEDLTFFLTAMREGGINASEGANALKSGLAALINPTKKSSDMLAGFGINIKAIVDGNKGNLKKTVVDFATALNTIDPLNRARAIEQMFGKFQFARISTLLQNVTASGSQASKALALANMSSIQLAAMSRKELDRISSSPMYKFEKAIADLQLKIAPVGEAFLKAVTPIVGFVSKMLDGFNGMSDQFKNFAVIGVAVIGGLAPVLLMVVGLVANGAANILKFLTQTKSFFNKTSAGTKDLGSSTSYLTTEQIKAEAVAASLDQIHGKLKQTFTSEAGAVDALTGAYSRYLIATGKYAAPAAKAAPGMFKPVSQAKGFATGGMVSGPGSGTSDSIPANLSNGEAVIDAETVNKNPAIIAALFAGKRIQIPGYAGNNSKDINSRVSLYGGKSRMLAGLAAYLPGNNSSFGMDRSLLAGSDNTLLSQRMTGAAVGGGFALDRKAGAFSSPKARLSTQLMDQYGEAVQEYIPQIVKTLKDTHASMVAAGEDTSKIDKVVSKAEPEMRKIFDAMKAKGGKAASAATAMSDHMMYPTKGAMESMGEHRVPAARETSGGSVKTTQFRALKSKFVGSVKTASEYFGPKISAQDQYAHLNGGSLPGPDYAVSGGAFGPQVSEQRRAALQDALGAKAERLTAQPAKPTQAVMFAEKQVKDLSDGLISGVKKKAKIQSPSKETMKVGEDLAQGAIDGMKSKAKGAKAVGRTIYDASALPSVKAALASGPKMLGPEGATQVGKYPTLKEPRQSDRLPGRMPSPFVERMRASVAAAPSNLANEGRMISNQAKDIFAQLKSIFKFGGKEAIDATRTGIIQETPRLRVAGKEAGFDYVTALKGGNGSIAAVVTAGNQKIIAAALTEYNAGGFKIAGTVSRGLDRGIAASLAKGIVAGQKLADSIVQGVRSKKQKSLPMGSQGPLEEGGVRGNIFQRGSKRVADGASAVKEKVSGGYNKLNSKINISSDGTGAIAKLGAVATTAAFALSGVPGPIGQTVSTLLPFISILSAVSGLMTLFSINVVAGTVSMFGLTIPILPLIAAIAGLALVIAGVIWWMNAVNDAKAKELKQINATSKAAESAADALNGIGQAAGVDTTDSGNKQAAAAAAGIDASKVNDVTTLANTDEFLHGKTAGMIRDLKAVTSDKDRKDILSGTARTLAASGADPKVTESTLAAIQLNTNKGTDRKPIAIDPKTYNAGTAVGAKALANEGIAATSKINPTLKANDAELAKKLKVVQDAKSTYTDKAFGGKSGAGEKAYQDAIKKTTDLVRAGLQSNAVYKNSVKTYAETTRVNINAVGKAFLTGRISLKAFKNAQDGVVQGFNNMSEQGKQDTLKAMREAMPADQKALADTAAKIKDAGAQLAYLQAVAAGATNFTPAVIAQANAAGAGAKGIIDKVAAAYNSTAQADYKKNNPTDPAVDSSASSGSESNPKDILTSLQDAVKASALTNQLMSQNYSADFISNIAGADAATQKFYTTIGKNGIPILNAQGKALYAAYNTKTINEFISAQKGIVAGAALELKARSQLKAAGLSAEDVKAMAARTDVQAALASANAIVGAKARAAAIKKVTDALKAEVAATKSLKTAQEIFQESYDKGTEYLSSQEAKINNDFDRLKSNVDNKAAILKANQAIEDLQNGVGGAAGLNKYSDGLSKLQFREDEINKKYEERAKALTKIATINQRISEQTKGQLSLAQALSSGDLSAAAQAAQDMNTANANAAMEDQKTALENAKQKELDSQVVSVNGKLMTRKEIEAASKVIQEQILDIQIKQLAPAQTALSLAERARDASLNVISNQKLEWESWKIAVDGATTSLDAYNLALAAAKPGGVAAATIPKTSSTPVPRKVSLGGGTSRMIGISSGGMVPKYLADGGSIFPSKGTDTMPAMLTPGEFVVRKFAVDSFGVDKLNAINNGTFGSDTGNILTAVTSNTGVSSSSSAYTDASVYNYSVNVNVRSDANPDQIAQAVMTKINQNNGQRIRGNRFNG